MKTDIDVVIPLLNGERWIEDTLSSVLSQSQKPGRIIIIDDGSTDRSREIVSRYREVELYQNPSKGGCAARNFGLEKSGAEFVAFVDQDDLWHEEFLRLMTGALKDHPEADVALSGITGFMDGNAPKLRSNGSPVEYYDAWEKFPAMQINVTTSAMVFRRKELVEAGGWPVEHTGVGDLSLYLKMTMKNAGVRIPDWLMGYRIHKKSFFTKLLKSKLDYINLRRRFSDDCLVQYEGIHKEPSKWKALLQRKASQDKIFDVLEQLFTTRIEGIEKNIEDLNSLLSQQPKSFIDLMEDDFRTFLKRGAIDEKELLGYLKTLMIRCSYRWQPFYQMVERFIFELRPGSLFYMNFYLTRPWAWNRAVLFSRAAAKKFREDFLTRPNG